MSRTPVSAMIESELGKQQIEGCPSGEYIQRFGHTVSVVVVAWKTVYSSAPWILSGLKAFKKLEEDFTKVRHARLYLCRRGIFRKAAFEDDAEFNRDRVQVAQVNRIMCERGDDSVELVSYLDIHVADVAVRSVLCAPLPEDLLEFFGREEQFLDGGWDVA